MSIDSRSLQRRNQLRQALPPEDLMEHRHSYWRHQDYTLLATGTGKIDTAAYAAKGHIVRLDPVVLMYTVQVEWFATVSFTAGGGDTFTLKLDLGYDDIKVSSGRDYTHDLIVTDVSEYFLPFFKTFDPIDVEFSAKVSNPFHALEASGMSLRFTLWERDSFGDYAKPTTRLLTDPYLSQRVLIQKYDKLSDEFTYLSGLRL